MELRTIYVLAFLAAGAIAGPLNARSRNTCSRRCTDSSKFNYAEGTTYTYRYEAGVITKVKGASDEHSGMHIRATADIEILSKCELALKLKDVSLEESDPRDESRRSLASNSEQFSRALENNPIHFSFQDGRIEDVCANVEDPIWVSNIKKAVLSSFQNSMDDLQINTKVSESDVTGQCETEYKLTDKGWGSFTVSKSKDLDSCSDRLAYRTAMQSTHYRVPTKIQSLPIMKGSHSCTQTFHTAGRMIKAECVESHVFRPFSKENSGAVTDARHSLEFIRERAGVSLRPSSGRRTTLKFEHEHRETDKGSDIEPALANLRNICSQTSHSVRPETPGLFARLTYQMKEMNERTLKDLHNRVARNQACRANHDVARRFFHDAIPMVGTTASVRLIAELINQKHIKGSEADSWLSSLAFVKNPTKDMVIGAAVLLQREPTKNTFLSVSAMVHTYCKTHSDCNSDVEIQRVAQTLQGRLNSNCKASNPQQRETVLVALKALGNMGYASRVTNTLNRCMLEESNPIEVRLAAINAFRRQPCTSDRSRLMDVFKDTNEDVEVRIAAYLAVMQCASNEIITNVQSTLEKEPVNQVGSFVWTHLTNLQESSDLHKQAIRRILEDYSLQKQFDLEKTKFSRNYEGSFFSDSLNTGAKVEGNVVFSPKSYVPRSAMLNLTFDLFGESVNLLEVGGRAEGMEKIVEKYFGPNGYFGNNLKDTRRKRSIPNAIRNLNNKFADDAEDEMSGSLYFKVFGHEIKYVDLMSLQRQTSEFNILDVMIMLAKEHDINYSKSFMFLDTSMTIPTITGLPIKLSVNGTATVGLKLKGKLDMRKLGSSPRSLDINGYLKPSGAVEVSAMMGVDAFVTQTGVKMISTLHSSTELDGKAVIQDSQIVQFKLNAPNDKVEILNAETKFYTIHRQSEREQKMLSVNPVVKEKCTGAAISKILGVEVCGLVQYPGKALTANSPYYPLTGPSKLTIALKKTDTHSGYQFDAKLMAQKNRVDHKTYYNYIARLAFDTPGSSVNRKFDFDFELNRADKKLHVTMTTPWKKAGLSGEIVDLPNEKRASLRFSIDDENVYSVNAGLNIKRGDNFNKFTPNIEIRIPGQEVITVNGGMDHQIGRKLDIDLSVNNLLESPLTFRGYIQKELQGNRHRFNTDIEIKSHIFSAKLGGYVEKKRDGYRSRLALDYGKGRKPEHRLVLSYKIRAHGTPSLLRMTMHTALQTTQFPEYSFSTRIEMQKAAGHAEGSISATYGSDPSNELKKIEASGILKYEKDIHRSNIDASMKFKYPLMKYDWDMAVFHNQEGSSMKSTAKIMNNQQEKLNLDITLLNQSTDLRKYTADISLKVPSRNIRFYQLFEERQVKEYYHDMIIQWAENKVINTRATYKHGAEKHSVTLDIRFPDKMPVNINAQANLKSTDLSMSASMAYDGNEYSAHTFYKQDNGRHIAGGKLIIPRLNPITANIIIKPNINDASLSASIMYQLEAYHLNAGYRWSLENGKATIGANAELNYPGRHVSGLVMIKHFEGETSAKIEMKCNSKNDAARIILFHAEYKRPTKTHHNGQLQINLLGKQIGGKFTLKKDSTNYQTTVELQWDRMAKVVLDSNFNIVRGWGTKKVNGGIILSTPFESLRKLGGTFSHTISGNEYTSQGDIFLGDNKIISSEVFINAGNLRDLEGRLSITTPFNPITLVKLHFKHILNDKKLNTFISGTVKEKEVYGEIAFKTDQRLEGLLKIKLPIRNLENIVGSFSHEVADGLLSNKAELYWSPTDKISIDTVLRSVGWKRADGHIRISTPFAGVKSLNLQLNHNMDQKSMHSKAHGSLGGKFVEYEIIAKKNGDTYSHDIEGTLRFKSSVRYIEDLGLSLKYNNDGKIYTGSADARWNSNSHVSSSVIVDHQSNGRYFTSEGSFQLKTPFTKVNDFKTSWRLQTDDDKFSSSCESLFNGVRYATFADAERKITSREHHLDFNLGLQTPFTKDIKSSLKTIIRNNNYFQSNGLLAYDSKRLVDFEAQFGYDKFDVDGNFRAYMSKHLNIAPMSGSVKTVFNSQPYSIHVDGKWAPEKNVIFDAALSYLGSESIVGSMEVSSPFTSTFGMSINHKKNTRDFSTRITTKWGSQQLISVETKVTTGSEKIAGSLNLQTPFERLSNMVIGFEHTGLGTHFSHSHNVYLTSNGKRSTLDHNYDYYGLNNIKMTSRLRSVYNLDTSFSQHVNEKELKSSVQIETPARKFNVNLNVKLEDEFKASLELNTPFTMIQYGNIIVTNSGIFPYITSSVSLATKTQNNNIDIKTSLQMTGYNSIMGKLAFKNSGIEGIFKDITLTSMYKKSPSSHAILGKIESMGHTYEVETTLDIGDKIVMSLKTPWKFLQMAKATLGSRGTYPYITANAQINTESTDGQMTIDGDLTMNSYNSISTSIVISTPYTHIPLSLSFNHGKIQQEWTTSLSAQTSDGKYEYTSKFNFVDAVHMSIDLRSPSHFLKTLSFKLDHEGEITDFKHRLLFEYNVYVARLRLENEWEVKGLEKINGNFKLTSPIRDWEHVSFKVNHGVHDQEWRTSADFDYIPGRRIQIRSAYSLGRSKKLDLTVTTPFSLLKKVSVSVSHEGTHINFINNVNIALDGKKFESKIHMDQYKEMRVIMKYGNAWLLQMDQKYENSVLNLETLYQYNNNPTAQFTFNVDARKDIKLKLSGTIHDLGFEIDLTHTGKAMVFKNNMKASVGHISAKTMLEIDTIYNILYNAEIKNLFNEPINVVLEQKATSGNWFLKADYRRNSVTHCGFSSNVNIQNNLNIELTLRTPNKHLKSLTLKTQNEGGLNSLTHEMKLKYHGEKEIVMETKLRMNGNKFADGSLTLNGLSSGPISANLNHRLTSNLKISNMNIHVAGKKIISLSSDLQFQSGIRYLFKFNGPCRYLKDISFEMDSAIDSSNNLGYKTKASLKHSMLSSKIQLLVELKRQPYEIKFMLKTPFSKLGLLDVTTGIEKISVHEYSMLTTINLNNQMMRLYIKRALYSLNNFNGEVSISTPFEYLRNVKFVFNHVVQMPSINTHFSLESSFGNFETKLSIHGLKGKIDIKTPYTGFEDIKLEFSHEGDISNCKSEFSAISSGKKVVFTSELAVQEIIHGEVRLTSNIENWENTAFSFSHQFDDTTAKTNVMVSAKGKDLTVAYKHNIGTDIEMQLDISTPFAGYENLFCYVKHAGNNNRFDTRFTLQYKQDKRLEATVNFYRVELSTIKFDLALKTPCIYLKNVKISYSHQDMSSHTFRCNSLFERNGETISATLDVKKKPEIEIVFAAKTPFRRFENLSLKFGFQGTTQNIAISSNIQFMTDHAIELEYTCTPYTMKRIESSLKVKTPFAYFKELSNTYKHGIEDGAVTIKLENVRMGERYALEIYGTLTPTYEAKVIIETPYEDYKSLSASVVHSGNARQFSTVAKIQYPGGIFEGSTKFLSMHMSSVELNIMAKTPFYKKVFFDYKHNGDLSRFESQNAFGFDDKVISSKILFTAEPLTGSLTIQTPFKSFEEMFVKVDRTTDLSEGRKSNINLNIQYMTNKKIEAGMDLNVANLMEMTVTLKAPFCDDALLNFKQQGKYSDFRASSKIAFGKNFVTGSLGFILHPINIDLKMKTSFDMYNDIHLYVSHYPARRMTSFALQYMDGKRITANAVVIKDGIENIQADITVNQPFTTNSEIKMSHQHSLTSEQFKLETTMKYGFGKKVAVTSSVKFTPKIVGHIEIISPFYKFERIAASAIYGASKNDLSTSAAIEYMTGKKIDMKFSFSGGESYTANMAVTTPFTGFESIVGEFSHEGKVTDFKSFASVKYNIAQKIEGTLQFTPTSSELIVKTPFKDWESVTIKYSYEAENHLQFKTTASVNRVGKLIEADLSFTPRNIQLNFKTPYLGFERNSFSCRTDGSLDKFETMAAITIGEKVHSGSLDFSLKSTKLNLNLPYKDIENIEFAWEIEGDASSFKMESHSKVNSNQIAKLTMEFTRNPKITAELKFSSIYTGVGFEHIVVKFDHEGSLFDFKTNAEVELSEGKKFGAKINFVPRQMQLKLRTPINRFEHIEAEYLFDGYLPNFKATTALKVMKDKSYHAQLSFRQTDAKLVVTMPDSRQFSMFYQFAGSLRRFQLASYAEYNNGKRIVCDVKFGSNDAKVTIRTPFYGYETMSGLYQFEDSKLNIDVEYMSLKHITVSGELRLNPVFGSLSVKTPFSGFESVSATFNQNGPLNEFNSRASVQYKTDQRLDVQIQTSLTSQKGSIKTSVFTPYDWMRETILTVNYDVSKPIKKAEAKLKYGSNKLLNTVVIINTESGFDSTISVSTPFVGFEKLYAHFNHKGSLDGFKTNGMIKYAEAKEIALSILVSATNAKSVVADILFKSPFKGYTKTSMKYTHLVNEDKVDANLRLGESIFSTNLYLSKENSYVGRFEVKTEWEILQRAGIHINGNDDVKNFNGVAQIFFNEKYVNIEFAAPSSNGVKGSMKVESSYLSQPIDLSIEHTRSMTSFKNVILILGRKLETEFSHGSAIEGKISAALSGRNVVINFRHQGPWRRFATEAKVQCNEHVISGSFDFSKSRRNLIANIRLLTPFEGWETSSATFRHQLGIADFRTKAKLQLKGMSNIALDISYKHNDEGSVSFRSPFKRFENIIAKIERNNEGLKCQLAWEPNKEIVAQLSGSLQFRNIKEAEYQGIIKIDTPFSCLKSLHIDSAHKHGVNGLFNHVKVILNQINIVDMEVEGKLTSEFLTGKTIIRSPFPVEVSIKLASSSSEKSAQANINWDTTSTRSKIEFLAQYKDGSTYYRTKHDGIVKVTLPWRIAAVTTTLESSKYQSSHKTELIWDQARGKKVSYGVTFHDKSRSYQRQWEVDFVLSSPVRTIQTLFNHNDNGRRFLSQVQLLWDASRSQQKKLSVSSLYENYGLSHKLELALKHPKLTKDITLRGELTLNKNSFVYAGKTEFEYSQDPSEKIIVSGKLNKIARGQANNYTMYMHVSHPKSLIDVELNSHIGRSENRLSLGTEMKYLTARRIKKNVFIMGEIDKMKEAIRVYTHTPLKSIELYGHMEGRQNGYSFNIESKVGGVRTLNGELEVDTKRPSVDIHIKDETNSGSAIHAYAKLVSGRELKLEIYRKNSGKVTTDGVLALHRNTSHLLHGRVHWNKDFMIDVVDYAKGKYNAAQNEAVNMVKNIREGLNDEARVRAYYLHNSIPDLNAVQNYVQAEIATFHEDGAVLENEWRQMFERNDFFLRDIYDKTTSAVEYISKRIEAYRFRIRRQMEEIRRAYILKMAVYYRKMDEVMSDMRDAIVDLVLKYRPAWQKYAYSVVRQYLVTSQTVNHKYQQLMESLEGYKDNVIDYLDDNYDYVSYRMEPYFQKLIAIRTNLRSHLSEKQQDRYIDIAVGTLVDVAVATKNKASELVVFTTEKYSEIKDRVKSEVTRRLDQLVGQELAQSTVEKLNNLYEKVDKITSDFKISQKVVVWAKKGYQNAVSLLKEQVHSIIKQYIRLDRSGLTVYDPANGEVQGEIFLPLAMEFNWDKLKHFNIEILKEEAERVYNKYIPQFEADYSMWDTYYRYKPTSDINNWIPPYKAHATLLGNEHYTTFDGRTYEFAGTCSYILARDFVNGHFTVLANYEHGSRKSITIISNEKEIEIFQDGKVTINGRQTELPYQHMSTSVTTTGDVITVTNALGLRSTCDLKNEFCFFSISGWYQGKTAGLLGTFDNEKSNDFMTPGKKIVNDINKFANSWRIGSCSASNNHVKQVSASVGMEQEKVCNDLFNNKHSGFRPCYKIVHPKTFYRRCLSDIKAVSGIDQIQRKSCALAKLYQTECEVQGVPLQLPNLCESCINAGFALKNGERRQLPAQLSTDVVFVIEEKLCNKDASSRLPHLVTQLDNALKEKGLANNLFGIVGYGGEIGHRSPHRHTLMNQIMNDGEKFQRGMSALTFKSTETSADVFAAIREAATYPFRAGTNKIIIAMPCSKHSHDTGSADMIEYLAEKRIIFHVLSGYDFTLRSRSPKSNYIFGADRHTAYTSKDVNQLRGDQALYNMLVLPKDKCATLALSRYGSVFNAKKLIEGRVNSQKFFLDVFARRVAAAPMPSQCNDCKCVNGQTDCKPCVIPSNQLEVLLPATRVRNVRSVPERSFEMKFQDA